MKIELSKEELIALGQALKVKIEDEITRLIETKKQNEKHARLGCPFNYCDSNPPCKGKCRYQ